MKRFSAILGAAAIGTILTTSAFAGSVGIARTSPAAAQPDAYTIAKLQMASERAERDGRNGNKNHPEFGEKKYQIDQLIERLKSGQQVDPAEIDKALEPAQVW